MTTPAGPRLWIFFASGVLALVFVWLALPHHLWRSGFQWRGQQTDYYNLLVDGFQAGHLHMNLPVHPDRLSPDPAVRAAAPYALDAGLYHGHYYLYYGVVPAVLVLWPYSALTGHDLSLNIVTLFFALVGYAFSLLWYARLRRAFFPRAGSLADLAVTLLLAFGPATTFLVRRSMFYELPLAAGYAFLCLFVYALTRALTAPERAARWIALASAALGCAAGCHPNHAVLTLLLALCTLWLLRRRGVARSSGARLSVAAVLPAALLGAALAGYNYARFGDPLNFGFEFGQNVFFSTGDKLLSASFLWPNFKWYYLTPPTLQPYFPFFYPIAATFRPVGYHGAEAMHGQFVFFCTALVILGFAFGKMRRNLAPELRVLAWTLVAMAGIAALALMSFGIRANRYMVDFQFPLAALVVVAIATFAHHAQVNRVRRLSLSLFLALAAATALNNTLAAIQQFDTFRNTRKPEYAALSAWLNPSWRTWEKLGLVNTGTLKLMVTFPPISARVGEPLLTTGGPGYSDTVYALQHPGGYLELMVDHHDFGGPRSRVLRYEPGRTYPIEIELGSFLPPEGDPYLERFDPSSARAHKHRARIRFNGETVISHPMDFHEAAPWDRQLGTNLVTHKPFATRFSGKIESASWSPLPVLPTMPASSALVRAKVLIPPTMPRVDQPLVASGVTGAGNLLRLHPVGEGEWRVQVDEWGVGLVDAAASFRLPPGEHQFDFLIGPLLGGDPAVQRAGLPAHLQPFEHALVVWLDGAEIGRFNLTVHLDSFRQIDLGTNAQGFSSAQNVFEAELERLPVEEADLIAVFNRLAP
jgi:hypothetical protein